jgi:hypothetical protein
MQDCQRRWIVHGEDLTAQRFSQTVAQISSAEIAKVGQSPQNVRAREGAILQGPDAKLYIVNELSPGNYQKRYITGTGWGVWFSPCGYGTQHLFPVSQPYLDT